MTFINEYICDEDIKKYKIYDLLNEYLTNPWAKHPFHLAKYEWTVDREKEIFFIKVGEVVREGASGRPEPTGKLIFILSIKNETVEFRLEHGPGGSDSWEDDPIKIVWKIVDIDDISVSRTELLVILKEALDCYGHSGMKLDVKNTLVDLKQEAF